MNAMYAGLRAAVVLGAAGLALLAAAPARAGTVLRVLEYAPDVASDLGAPDELVLGGQVAREAPAGTVVALDVSEGLPAGVEINAYAVAPDGSVLAALDSAARLDDVDVESRDVVRLAGGTLAVVFDGDDEGVPDGVRIDALAIGPGEGRLLLSFDTAVDLPEVGTVQDEDLVGFDGVFDASVFFDGDDAGVSSQLDLDGADYLPKSGHLLLSFDGSGSIDDLDFDDEDVLEYNVMSGTWELAYDGSASPHGWPGASDLQALLAQALHSGDCDEDGETGIVELQGCANLFLQVPSEACPACDSDGDGEVGITELQGAVNCFLDPGQLGCPNVMTP